MRRCFDACVEKSAAHLQAEQARIKSEFETAKQTFNQEWRQAVRDIGQSRSSNATVITEKAARLVRKNQEWRSVELDQIQQRHAETVACLKREDAAQVRKISEAHQTKLAQVEAVQQHRWQELAADWES